MYNIEQEDVHAFTKWTKPCNYNKPPYAQEQRFHGL